MEKSQGKASRQQENPLPCAQASPTIQESIRHHTSSTKHTQICPKSVCVWGGGGAKIWHLPLNTEKVTVNAFFSHGLMIFMVLFCSSLFALAAQHLFLDCPSQPAPALPLHVQHLNGKIKSPKRLGSGQHFHLIILSPCLPPSLHRLVRSPLVRQGRSWLSSVENHPDGFSKQKGGRNLKNSTDRKA